MDAYANYPKFTLMGSDATGSVTLNAASALKGSGDAWLSPSGLDIVLLEFKLQEDATLLDLLEFHYIVTGVASFRVITEVHGVIASSEWVISIVYLA